MMNSVNRRFSVKARPSISTMPSRPPMVNSGIPASSPVTSAAATTTRVVRSFSAKPMTMIAIPSSFAQSGNAGPSHRPLPLHPPRPVALQQTLHFVHAEPVEVPRNRMFEARGRHRELQRFLMAAQRLQPVNQPAGEAVAAADPVHDMGDLVVPADQEILS